MSVHAQAIAAGLAAIALTAGEPVTYIVGDTEIPIAHAVPVTSAIGSASADGIATAAQTRDWKIRAADLVIAGQVITPEQGHAIAHLAAGIRTTYRVSIPDGGQDCYRPQDHGGTWLRVHCVAVNREAV